MDREAQSLSSEEMRKILRAGIEARQRLQEKREREALERLQRSMLNRSIRSLAETLSRS